MTMGVLSPPSTTVHCTVFLYLTFVLLKILHQYFRACWAVSNKDFVEAYRCQALIVQSFCKLLSSQKDDNWPLPMMYAFCLDLRLFAIKADQQLSKKGGKPGKIFSKIMKKF